MGAHNQNVHRLRLAEQVRSIATLHIALDCEADL